ncbi:MAG: S41 family peptidase [Muribaculaceae bacterium]
MKKINPIAWIPLSVAIALVAGIWLGGYFHGHDSTSGGVHKLNTILGLIDRDYVDTVDIDELVELSIPEILANLDPHSTYIPASDLRSVNDELEGSFSGIGIQFSIMNDTISVIESIAGGPSEKVGIMAGDRIVQIGDSIVAGIGITNEQVLSMLRGPEGTRVKLGIKRNSARKTLTYEVTRGAIPVTSVDASYIVSSGIGYIKVNKFGRTTYDEFLTALTSLRRQGAEKYLVDLRGNGGGYMEIAILMANEFLPEGSPIVYTKGRNGIQDPAFSDGNGSFQDAEIAVLIDEFSASASEIFAGAIQDNDRGLIIGRRSFGKGLVQRQSVLPDSSAMRLTIARYYTPSGRCIQKEYTPGKGDSYSSEIIERYNHGEAYSADSMKIDRSQLFHTAAGREVYGGGGIIPDVFTPNDTTGVSSYYMDVANAGLLQRFAFSFADLNRESLKDEKDVTKFLKELPSDAVLLQSFVRYAAQNGVPARWYYINKSHDLLVNQLKALIARDLLGYNAFYSIYNQRDSSVKTAVEQLSNGNARFPLGK